MSSNFEEWAKRKNNIIHVSADKSMDYVIECFCNLPEDCTELEKFIPEFNFTKNLYEKQLLEYTLKQAPRPIQIQLFKSLLSKFVKKGIFVNCFIAEIFKNQDFLQIRNLFIESLGKEHCEFMNNITQWKEAFYSNFTKKEQKKTMKKLQKDLITQDFYDTVYIILGFFTKIQPIN